MATRSLMALDYANHQTNVILRKQAKNRPLGEIEHKHNYVPAQPVLSCRTVNIDLPGTRTYRPKSTLDILEEQQRLIRNIYNKQRVSASAPPRQRVEPKSRSSSEHSIRRVNIEVKGRPLTSLPHSSHVNEEQVSVVTHRRPKTTGRLKNVQPATDSFMVIKVDKDFLATSKSNKELTNKLHAYWRSENNNLAQGKFVRGQKRPDDVPPTLDAWLTFGGAAGDSSDGVIDAFANFKNSEEYYNIEGSVGSRVAEQLQKGDKIRIGINGILQSQDLKIKKWNKENAPETSVNQELKEMKRNVEKDVKKRQETLVLDTQTENEIAVKEEPDDTDALKASSLHGEEDDDFKELVIDAFDDLLEDPMDVERESPKVQQLKPRSPAPVKQRPESAESEVDSPPALTIPLSWDDQCTKPNVKVIHSTMSPREKIRPVMSETFPVKFEKLINRESRPKLAQPRKDGYRIKQRSASRPADGHSSVSKVRVVYIDPLTQEEEVKVRGMSVEEIINGKMEGRSRENTGVSLHNSLKENGHNIIAINEDCHIPFRPHRASSRNSGSRNSRPTSNYSLHSDHHNGIPSPKLKTFPVHSSASHFTEGGDLTILSTAARHSSSAGEAHRASKTPGRITPSKPLHRAGAGQGSSIKAGPLQGETEYIKITSQLKIPPAAASSVAPPQSPVVFSPYHFSPGSNTPKGADCNETLTLYTKTGKETPENEIPDTDPESYKDKFLLLDPLPTPDDDKNNADVNENDVDELNDTKGSVISSDSQAPTTVAISIPTADELSDKESPTSSPTRYASDDRKKAMQKRERNLRDEQIDQITDLLGSAIVDS